MAPASTRHAVDEPQLCHHDHLFLVELEAQDSRLDRVFVGDPVLGEAHQPDPPLGLQSGPRRGEVEQRLAHGARELLKELAQKTVLKQ